MSLLDARRCVVAVFCLGGVRVFESSGRCCPGGGSLTGWRRVGTELLTWALLGFPGSNIGLGTSALAGDPDPYPRVFGRQMSHPDP